MTRRDILKTAAAAGLTAATAATSEAADPAWDFLLVGDLHYDRLEHHDMEWMKREMPNDIRQVENYSRITREVLPGLFQELKGHITANKRIAFVSHIGDFVEGCCGSPALARTQCQDAIAFTRGMDFGKPFVFCKGNHDVTGPGALDAYNEVLLPFTGKELGRPLSQSCFTDRRGSALFAYYDSYRAESLDWLEATLAQRKKEDKTLFVVIHQPVVPYNARANWHVFGRPNQIAQRTRLLNLLGKHRAIVLSGHLHKYSTLVRQTPEGPFLQLAVASVLPNANIKAKDELTGVKAYGPDLLQLEPDFAPTTLEERRANLAAETPFIKHFEYADLPGYGVIKVSDKGDVTADIYAGLGKRLWRTVPLTDLLKNA